LFFNFALEYAIMKVQINHVNSNWMGHNSFQCMLMV
jgi:hypothetical protein